MLVNPRLRSSYQVQIVGSRLVFLLDEHRTVFFQGEAYPALVPFLDGRNSLADIAGALENQFAFPRLIAAISSLEKRGCLIEGQSNPDGSTSAFLDYPRPGTRAFDGDLGCLKVAVEAVGAVKQESMADALRQNGFLIDEIGEVRVVVTDDYLRSELADINRQALSRKQPWLLAKPVGLTLWIGPLFQPGETACWACLAQRLRGNRQTERYILERTRQTGPIITSCSYYPATADLGYQLTALQLVEGFLASPGRLRGCLVTLDLGNRRTLEHTVVRRPQCPECGDRSYRQNYPVGPLALARRPKRFVGDGGHRSLTPDETYARYRHHISPHVGAVTEVTRALGSWNDLTPSFSAGHNFSLGLDSIVHLRGSIRAVSGGKGVTEVQARVSALCEALERYSGIYSGDEYKVRGSHRALKPAAIHPNECMGFSEEQFRRRRELNAEGASRCTVVPNVFDEEMEIDWTPIWSLTHERVRYLPTALCYYDHPEFRGLWCSPDSNGTAAGNSREEAIVQGFCELVERDAVAIWWYNRVRRRGVDLASVNEPYLNALEEHYRALGRDLWVLDITSDIPVTTIACLSRRLDRPVEDILLGFGAHFDPRVALLRAVTEVNQFLPAVAMLNPDGSTRYIHFDDAVSLHWWKTATVRDNPYLLPDPGVPPARWSDFGDASRDDLLDDVNACVELCRRKGLEMLVLDQTRPDIELSVVKVVVPELCHFWRRFGKLRLREVPARMNWRSLPAREDEFNTYTIFF